MWKTTRRPRRAHLSSHAPRLRRAGPGRRESVGQHWRTPIIMSTDGIGGELLRQQHLQRRRLPSRQDPGGSRFRPIHSSLHSSLARLGHLVQDPLRPAKINEINQANKAITNRYYFIKK